MKNKESSYEGLQADVKKLKTPQIEVWENQYAQREYEIQLQTEECSCICPKTGLPDFIKLNIMYTPGKWCLELKSFKLYLVSYRNVGIFHEHIVNKILDDIVAACKPRAVRVEGAVAPRGGITTTVRAQYKGK